MGLGVPGLRFGHPGRRPGLDIPNAEVLKDFFYDVFGLNESDDGRRPMTIGTRQGIDFIDLLYQPCPVPAVSFVKDLLDVLF